MRQAGTVRRPSLGRWLLAVVALLAGVGAVIAGVQPSARHHVTVTPSARGGSRAVLSPQLKVVALGDSVPAGSGCGCAPFPVRYANSLAAQSDRRVTVSNDGVPGLTSAGLTAQLQDGQTTADDVASADVISITIGANDFDYAQASDSCPGGALGCYDGRLATLSRQLAAILGRVAALRRGASTTVLLTGYWDIWKDGRVAAAAGPRYETVGNQLTGRVNERLQRATAGTGARYVDLVTAFRGTADDDDTGLLADDGDHPNTAGHQVIADALLAATPGVPTRDSGPM